MEWRIWYGDGSIVTGSTADEWRAAPSTDVQVIVVPEPYPDVNGQPWRPWAGVSDRQLWTGDDEYDPFGWGVKYGAWMTDEAYAALWQEAAYGK